MALSSVGLIKTQKIYTDSLHGIYCRGNSRSLWSGWNSYCCFLYIWHFALYSYPNPFNSLASFPHPSNRRMQAPSVWLEWLKPTSWIGRTSPLVSSPSHTFSEFTLHVLCKTVKIWKYLLMIYFLHILAALLKCLRHLVTKFKLQLIKLHRNRFRIR